MAHISQYPTDALFKGLKNLLSSLPSEEEKAELILTLQEAKCFIEEIEQLVEAFPTVESSRGLSEGLARLDLLAGLSYKETRLKRLMGFQASSPSRVKQNNGSGEIVARVEELKELLATAKTDNLLEVIESSKEPVSVLTALAASLGLRTRSKERKSDLIQRIVTHIVNQRGHRMLREGDIGSEAESVPTAT